MVVALLLLPLAAALPPPGAPAPWMGWRAETALASGYLQEGFALDPAGRPHVYSFSSGVARHGWWDGVGWTSETVPLGHWAGFGSALAFDASGTLHAAVETNSYNTRDANGAHLAYATRSALGTWTFEEVDGVAATADLGASVRLFFDASGSPHLTYVNGQGATRRGEMHAWRDGAGWHREVVDARGVSWQSGVIDPTGAIHVCYTILGDDPVRGYLMHAERPAGGAWSIESVARGSEACGIASDGARVHVAWTRPWLQGLEYAVRENGAWTTQELAAGSASTTDLVLDAAHAPHVAYGEAWHGGHDALDGQLYYLTPDGRGGWLRQTVDANPGGGTPLVRLDAHDRPQIAYFHVGDVAADTVEPGISIRVARPLVAEALSIVGR